VSQVEPSRWELLREHAFLLLRRWREIRDTPHLFFASAGRCHVMWVVSCEVPLGVLVHLWRLGTLAALCPHCGQLVLIHDLSGSALSGSHDWRGACRGCQHAVARSDLPGEGAPEFMKLWRPLVAELAEHGNEREVEPGLRPRFSWGKGLVGIRTPDRVIRPKVDPAPLLAVIDVLRGGPGRVAVRWPGGDVAYCFDWADRALRTSDGAVVLRLADERVLDGAGALVWTWDSLHLRRADGSIEYELTQRTADLPRGGRARLTDANVAALWGGGTREAGWRIFLGPFDGAAEYEIRSLGVGDAHGAPLVEHDAEIPIPIALWAARSCQTHQPQ
jgi:hypothetical protein